MKHDKSLKTGGRKSSGVSVWYIIGGATLVLVAAGFMTSFHDIRRYLRIRSM